MIKPLSVWKYYRNNQKNVTVVLVITSLSVFLQCALLIYVTTMLKLEQASLPWKSIFYVYTGKSKQSQLIQLLGKHPAISKVLPVNFEVTSRYSGESFIFLLNSNDINPVMNSLHLTLMKGQLPTPGTHEVVLHWKIAALKGLKIGNHFGNKYSQLELLMGDYKLVGLLDGDLIIGFSDLDSYINDYHLSKEDTAFLVIPQKGQLAEVESYLAQCVRKDPELYTGRESTTPFINTANIILNVIYLVITCIVTICVGFLFYIYFYQRRPECCLLEALGYTRRMIIGRAFLEITGINLLGFMLGIVICLLSGYFLNSFVLVERGLPLVLWDMSYMFKLLSTPLFIIFSSLLPVWSMLKKVDLISIIEGEV